MVDKIKAVLVGCGGISGAWLDGAKKAPELQMVGLVDVREEAAKERAEQYRLTKAVIGTDLGRVLAQTSPDVVFDCTIPQSHLSVTETAIRHGCHVLGEKPMADTMENARKMVALAQESGKIFAVMQNRRFNASLIRLKDVIRSGALGPITTVNSDFYMGWHMPDKGFRAGMPHILLHDMAIHTFDMARALSGADPVNVYCHEWNPPGSFYKRDASAMCIFEMTNGLIYSYRGSWAAEGLPTTWESEWRVVGQRGTARWNGADAHGAIKAQVANGRSPDSWTSSLEGIEVPPRPKRPLPGHTALIKDFVLCLQEGRTPETICTDNIKSVAMTFAAIRSAEMGTKVRVEW
jgi:predicted dehydrogenase